MATELEHLITLLVISIGLRADTDTRFLLKTKQENKNTFQGI